MVSLFSEDFGRLTILAKGVKKITSRRSPHLQTGNLIDIIVNNRNEHYYLQESHLISGFSDLKSDENKVKYLYLFLFVLDRLIPERQKENKTYNLTKKLLINLTKSDDPKMVTHQYLSNIMIQLGYLDKKISFAAIKSLIEEIISEKIPSLPL